MSNLRKKPVLIAALVVVLALVAIVVVVNRRNRSGGGKTPPLADNSPNAPTKVPFIDRRGVSDGPYRKKAPLNPDAERHIRNQERALEQGYGTTPPLTEEEKKNPQVQSVIKALNTKDPKTFGKYISPMIKADPFDRKKYESDEIYRKDYLSSAQPGRVFQTDAKGKFKLDRASQYFQEVVQGKSVFIEVKGEPNMPVSICSFDLGKFGNGLTFETKAFDKTGFASFEFKGMPGTIADANILVSSPACRGQLKFIVHTLLPPETETISKNDNKKSK